MTRTVPSPGEWIVVENGTDTDEMGHSSTGRVN